MYRKLMWIVLAGFALRVTVRWLSGGNDFFENGYTFFFELARNIATGNGLTLDGGRATAVRVPLYPLFLAAVTFGHQVFLPVVLAQSLVGAGTVCCAAMLARDMFGNNAAIIAAILTATYPYYVVHDTALQETSLYTLLTALAVLLLVRASRSGSAVMAIGAGLALGSAVMTRANLAPIALFAPLWLAFFGRSCAALSRRRLWIAVLCGGVVALTVSPWLARSYLLTGSPTLSTQSGYFLWLGNNSLTFSRYPRESIDVSEHVALDEFSAKESADVEGLSANEALLDRWFLEKGLNYIRQHPWQSVFNGVRKIGAAFCWLPSPRRSFWPNLVYLLTYAPIMLLGLCGMWACRQEWREHMIFYALFFSFAAVTAVFFGHTNYRAYLDVYWIVFAAGLLEQWPVQRLMFNPKLLTSGSGLDHPYKSAGAARH